MAKRDRVQATVAFKDLARALVSFSHQLFDPLGFVIGVDDAEG